VGGRVIAGVILGVAVVAVAVAFADCLPQPEDEIEWLHREDAVIVQMRVSEGSSIGMDARPELPDLTLYGDGTLILSVESPSETTLVVAALSAGKMEDLLGSIEEEGFFDFTYSQPTRAVSDADTTYLYVNTKFAANAVSAYALGADAPESDEWRQFRKLARIRERIDRLAEEALGGVTEALHPDGGELVIVPLYGNPADYAPWPFPQIDVSGLAGTPEGGLRRLSPGELEVLRLADAASTTCWCGVVYNGRPFSAYYRPLLPYEEHFPEFETPQ
jgi:hypothetical protein